MLRQLLAAFGILGICMLIHIAGIMFVGDQLVRRRHKIEQHVGTTLVGVLLIVVFGFILLLHLTEALVWALFYTWGGFFSNFETALYFSLKTYSTVGYGDVLLPENSRLVGTMEGILGVLQCGLSTAFLFAVVNALFRFRFQQIRQLQDQEVGRTYILEHAEKS
jgi:hypothetical protein